MTTFRSMACLAAAAAAGAVLGAGAPASARAAGFELTLAHFLPASHPVSKWTVDWAKEMEQKSNGALKFTVVPGAQLGPTPKYYDIARRGQADITWFLHGGTPGRFPLTELSNLPFLFCSAEQATKVVNDAGLRAKYLDPEHTGVKVVLLVAHVPGQVWMSKKPVESIADFSGAAIRPPSRTIGAFLLALGAKSVGMPPNELAENMQKGTLDGTFMDYPAGTFAFKLGPVTQHITEIYGYTTSLGVAMNPESWKKLPANLQKIVTGAAQGREKEVAGSWDNFDQKAKQALVKGGTKIVKLDAAEMQKFRALGAKVSADWVKDLDAKKLPASAAYKEMQALAAKHKATSASFCPN
ncbi:MAG: TRAP transporter substrate-binding protein [Burkholderiales bacterium]|nr:TRAP transporter substrate-binding protein [Burkholderiales bacterium]